MIDTQLERELGLNPPVHYAPISASWQYGANWLLRDYCGVRYTRPFKTIRWVHGWLTVKHQFDHRLYTAIEGELANRIFVAREDEKVFLASCGVFNVDSVGLPFAYVPDLEVPRRPNSLLVMPVHSLWDTQHDWKFTEYVNQIDQIASHFSEVVVCVHPSCIQHGYWAPQFAARNYRIVSGALTTDANALVRLKKLLSSFEYLTTNGTGSHVAYAAASGCKVSMFGTFPAYRAKDFAKNAFYQQNPGLIEKQLDVLSEATCREQFPNLFVDPSKAVDSTDWGKWQIGWDCRPEPSVMRKLMNWTLVGLAYHTARSAKRRLFR